VGSVYVYSSRHSSEEAARRDTLQRYIGPDRDLPARKIPIRSGHRPDFLEEQLHCGGSWPADSSSPSNLPPFVLVELSAKLIGGADASPTGRSMDIVAKRFKRP